MERRKSELKQEIQQRRGASGLGVACTEAQADGVPCPDHNRDCDRCERAGTAARPARTARKGARARA